MPDYSLFILAFKNSDEKVRGEKKKKNNKKYQRNKREKIKRRGGILEISIY